MYFLNKYRSALWEMSIVIVLIEMLFKNGKLCFLCGRKRISAGVGMSVFVSESVCVCGGGGMRVCHSWVCF